MIILTKDMILQNNNLLTLISNEREIIDNNIDFQQKIKNILLEYMQKFADSTNDINPDYSDIILGFLDNLKNSLQFTNNSLDLLKELLDLHEKLLSDIQDNNFELTFDYINDFNSKYIKLSTAASKNMVPSSSFLYSILTYSDLIFTEKVSSSNDISDVSTAIPEVEDVPNEMTSDKNVENISSKIIEKSEEDHSFNMQENTLVVSETKKKVFLPFYIEDLKKALKDNPDKYANLEAVVLQDYSLPISMFKNLSIARFREAFRLIRNKENGSIKKAFDLGMELLFNYDLHPAIISACRNIDILDIYLDYLENNETDKFDCFKIVFDMLPVVVKEKK